MDFIFWISKEYCFKENKATETLIIPNFDIRWQILPGCALISALPSLTWIGMLVRPTVPQKKSYGPQPLCVCVCMVVSGNLLYKAVRLHPLLLLPFFCVVAWNVRCWYGGILYLGAREPHPEDGERQSWKRQASLRASWNRAATQPWLDSRLIYVRKRDMSVLSHCYSFIFGHSQGNLIITNTLIY